MGDEHFQLGRPKLNVDWSNDDLFFTYEWEVETNWTDDHQSKKWCPRTKCYLQTYKVRAPIAFKECDELISVFIAMMDDSFYDCEGFWVD